MPEWVVQLVTMGAGAAGVYAGIRYDLGQLREKAEGAATSAAEAHKRLDVLMMGARRAS